MLRSVAWLLTRMKPSALLAAVLVWIRMVSVPDVA
jgi:hypothetical protein